MKVFYDSRLETDLSLDRLGIGNPEKKVVKRLTAVADSHGAAMNPSREFSGWAGFRAKDVFGIEVKPTPLEDNPYHADLSRDQFRTKTAAETLAWRLALHATNFGLIEPQRARA